MRPHAAPPPTRTAGEFYNTQKNHHIADDMVVLTVGAEGFEPPTLCL